MTAIGAGGSRMLAASGRGENFRVGRGLASRDGVFEAGLCAALGIAPGDTALLVAA